MGESSGRESKDIQVEVVTVIGLQSQVVCHWPKAARAGMAFEGTWKRDL